MEICINAGKILTIEITIYIALGLESLGSIPDHGNDYQWPEFFGLVFRTFKRFFNFPCEFSNFPLAICKGFSRK
jgi:hypothetical protein